MESRTSLTGLFYLIAVLGCLLFSCHNLALKEETPINLDEEIIIEGTVISKNRGLFEKMRYESYLVEVNTVFNGTLKKEVIEIFNLLHGWPQWELREGNVTAIFKIKHIDNSTYYQNLKKLSPFQLYYSVAKTKVMFPDKNFRYRDIHIEKDIYQKLEKESGKKRTIVFSPATYDKTATEYSKRKQLLFPNRQTGIIYKIFPNQNKKMKDHISFGIKISGTNSATYLQKGELIITYNNEAFGDSIVTNQLLKYEIPRNYRLPKSSSFNAIPEHFQVNIKDVDKNKFKIEWINPNTPDSCLQILPTEKGISGASLYFKPINMDATMELKISGVDSSNLRYDYLTKTVIPYEYVATPIDLPNAPVKHLMPASIDSIIPDKTIQPLDTITLIGKNLGRIQLRSVTEKGSIDYINLPKKHILNWSDTLIQLIVPSSILKNNIEDRIVDWTPITGPIKSIKGWDIFEVKTWSEKKLKIKEKVPAQ